MITIKTSAEISKMREAGRVVAGAHEVVRKMIAPGVTTKALDKAVKAYIEKCGATPSFLGYRGFPASTNVSVNQQVIHGIPDGTVLKEGDIASVDIGAYLNGYHGDGAKTYAVGEIDSRKQRLIDITRMCFYEGIKFAKAGCRLYDISAAIQSCAEQAGYSVVRDYVGHGIGRSMHEAPEVPNFKPSGRGRGPTLSPGMTIAIEPMVNAGGSGIIVLDDGWTVETADGSMSAHYEHTVLITKGEPELLTVLPEGCVNG